MILKTLDLRKSENQSVVYDEWNFFDNITSAATFYDEVSESSCVRCTFRDGNVVTITIPYVAYLMSDSGKTIECIRPTKPREEDEAYPTMQQAVEAAMKD